MSATSDLPRRSDVLIIGAGHNGLVAATLLARAGLTVTVLEATGTIGGAARTEHPFAAVPGLGHSTGAYLLGLLPPELAATLDLRFPTRRRDPHYFLPTAGPVGSPYLLAGADREASRAQLREMFSPADLAADDALAAELAALREDLAPAWLAEPLPVEQTADRYVRPALQQSFIDLVRGSVADYLARFEFRSELLTAMYAVTDGLSGVNAGPDDPGTGHNFLVHNMCRLPEADGTWLIVEGGMGTVTRMLADTARAAGAIVVTGAQVTAVQTEQGAVSGVALADGTELAARVVLGACDPYQLLSLTPAGLVPPELPARMAAVRRTGTTLKLNLALRDLPEFRCLPATSPSPFGATIHLLPGAAGDLTPMAGLRQMWREVQAGQLPADPTIEWYLHTTVDPSLQDEAGHHSSALFVQSVPYQITGSSWEAELPGYVDRLLEICDRYAPGTSALVADTMPLPPPGIEAHFGITGGHIHHIDNTVSFTDRMPYATGAPGLYAGSAGCHPAGSVIGAAGHNAAQRILRDLGLPTTG
ncbi:NAD(P)/FAD-dependent oxidoreductase [Natronosporangium hydrolyticum]|uniref:Pyridine nucleotide-disulfide oxidoreductase domain-containing protein 2 n=1 Tax=Natronosporangium hydrolyticum TaxID=2811111 RepID=A0A895YIB7_9ACTN|nr:NAD(P)/FAD-dependent oxidoreductase [Natronosporangium hydrolyticum]QSB13498.1 NAD(P)/FAD-dependent oxidoreductase [Natronosporangium hydrolyticum]